MRYVPPEEVVRVHSCEGLLAAKVMIAALTMKCDRLAVEGAASRYSSCMSRAITRPDGA